VIVCGLSGAGKTHHSLILEQSLEGYRRVHLGDLRNRLGITTYSRKDTPKLLAMAISEIEKNFAEGYGSILDANLKSVDLRQCFYDLAKELGVGVVLVEMVCSDETTKLRMGGREQTSLAENPREFNVFLEQKKVWQDTLMDLSLDGNTHVALVRYDSEKNDVALVSGNKELGFFVEGMLELMKK